MFPFFIYQQFSLSYLRLNYHSKKEKGNRNSLLYSIVYINYILQKQQKKQHTRLALIGYQLKGVDCNSILRHNCSMLVYHCVTSTLVWFRTLRVQLSTVSYSSTIQNVQQLKVSRKPLKVQQSAVSGFLCSVRCQLLLNTIYSVFDC